MKNFRLIISTVSLFCILGLLACGGKNNATVEEENLVVTTNPPTLNNHVEAPAPGPDFPLEVTITSKMPAAGVKIDVLAKVENTTTPFFTASRSGTAAQQEFSITETPRAVACVVEITVTSNSKPSNTWTGSYRYSRK